MAKNQKISISSWFFAQVFSAVPFSQYHPEIASDQDAYRKLDVNRNIGHFDRYNFDHISFYVGDYMAGKLGLYKCLYYSCIKIMDQCIKGLYISIFSWIYVLLCRLVPLF